MDQGSHSLSGQIDNSNVFDDEMMITTLAHPRAQLPWTVAVAWAVAGAGAVAEALAWAGCKGRGSGSYRNAWWCGLQALGAQSSGWQGSDHNNRAGWSEGATGGPKGVPTKGALRHQWLKGRLL